MRTAPPIRDLETNCFEGWLGGGSKETYQTRKGLLHLKVRGLDHTVEFYREFPRLEVVETRLRRLGSQPLCR